MVSYCVDVYFQISQRRSTSVLQVRPDQVRVVECEVLTTNDIVGTGSDAPVKGHRGKVVQIGRPE